MADRKVIVDTSVIIDFLRKHDKEKTYLWQIKENHVCFMSSVTLFELLSGAKTEKAPSPTALTKRLSTTFITGFGPALPFESNPPPGGRQLGKTD